MSEELHFYNTLTRKLEPFVPLDQDHVRFYGCGPTVYDYFHIGNARSFVMADIVRRYLEYSGYNVKFIMNLTDIEDRIIKKANEQNKDAKDISGFYSQAFFDDIKKLKIKPASIYPKATEYLVKRAHPGAVK